MSNNLNIEKQEIMILVIELGENEKKFLKIYPDSKPEKLSYDFCLQNNLDFNSLQELTEEIKNALKQKEILIKSLSNNNIISNINSNEIFFHEKKNNEYKGKRIKNLYKIDANENNKNYHYLSQTISSQTKKKNLKLNLSRKKINKTPNGKLSKKNIINNINKNIINNINQYINNNITNSNNNINNNNVNNLENDYDINISQLNEEKKNKSQENFNLNYGERLYNKGLKLQEKTNEKIQKIKNEKEKNEKKNFTFKPKLNNISYTFLTKISHNKLKNNNEENIKNYKNYINNKIESLKEKYDKKEEKYSFNPKINKRSKTIDKNNSYKIKKIIPRYETLYDNYKKKELDIHNLSNKIYDKKKLFKPKINNFNSDLLNIPFKERLNIYQLKSKEKKNQIKNLIENPIDNLTGQKFFSPLINNNYERKINENIFNNLYFDYQKKEQKIHFLTQQIQKEENFNLIYVNNTSNKFYNEQKINSFKKIFHILDKNHNGIINKFSLEDNQLNYNLKKIFSPIFEELKEENQNISQKEFIQISFKLFDNLNLLEKRDIINFGNEKKKKDYDNNLEFTFKPKINNNFNSETFKKEIQENISFDKYNNDIINNNNEEEEVNKLLNNNN